MRARREDYFQAVALRSLSDKYITIDIQSKQKEDYLVACLQ